MVSFQSTKVKLLVPLVLGVFLAACGAAPIIPPPPGAPGVPGVPANPLAPLTNLAPDNEAGDALRGLGALSQLGTAFDQQGNVSDPNAVQNFLSTIQDIEKQQNTREFAEKESLEFPENAPPVLKTFAYANGKLVSVNDNSNSPNFDFNLKYQTLDVMKTVGDFYKNLAKTLSGGWKTTAQSTSTDEGSLTLQNQTPNGEENLTVRWSEDGGITTIQVRFWTYYNS